MILENINEEIDPCENFYEFSCGMYSKTKRIPEDEIKIEIIDTISESVNYKVAGREYI